jgi:hypothetical protein
MVPFYAPLIGQGKSLMRTAFATVILAAAAVTAAQAQTPPTSTPPAPSATAAPPAATPAAPPTTTAPGTPSTTAPAAPSAAAPAAPAATPPAQADQAAAAPPTLPTTGPGAVLLNVVEKICVPLVRGGNLDQLAPQIQGAKKNRRDMTWTIPLDTNRDHNLTLSPPGVNKDVCRGEVHYGADDEKTIVTAFNTWSFLHQPELILQANYVEVDADNVKRVRKSWEHIDSASSTAVNFTTWTKPDDTPLNKGYSTGEVFYQERKIQ